MKLYIVSTKGDWGNVEVRRLIYSVVGHLAYDYRLFTVLDNSIAMEVYDGLEYVVLNIGLAGESLLLNPEDVLFMLEFWEDEYIQIDVCTAAKVVHDVFDIDLDNVLNMCKRRGYE